MGRGGRTSRFALTPVVFVLTALSLGCTPSFPFPNERSGPEPVLDVPFFPGTDHLCGPASLASVMNYWHVPVSVDEVAQGLFRENLRGVLPFELGRFARERGLRATSYEGGLQDLRNQIDEGHPLIVFVNLGNSLFPVGHYLVVVGYSADGRWLIAHSGGERDERIALERFFPAWQKMDFWTLLILPTEGQPGAG